MADGVAGRGDDRAGDPAKRDPKTRQSADHSMVYIVGTLLRKAAERVGKGGAGAARLQIANFLLAAVLEREDPRDAFVSNDYASLDALPPGAVVGTSSLRRQSLIAARFPQLLIQPLRGNLDTRLAKLDRGDLTALAAAGALASLAGHRHNAVWEVAGASYTGQLRGK